MGVMTMISAEAFLEAALAIDLIRKRIHEPDLPPQRIILPVSLVCRESCV